MNVRTFRKTTLFIGCLLQVFLLSAQINRTITVEEAIGLSIQHSGQLRADRAKIDETTAALKEAVDRRLPSASVSGSHVRLSNPNVDLKTKPSGGGTTAEPMGKISSATYGILNVSLPLYSGSKIRYGIESSQYLAEATKLDADYNKEQIILNTINAFDNLYKAKAAVAVVKESLEGTRERVKQFTNLERNGVLARNDLLKAELQSSNVEISLLDAENNWKLANINMDLMLGLPDSVSLDPQILNSSASSALKSVEDFISLALQNRKDISALSLRKKAAETGIHLAKSDYYPGLALTGGYIAAYVPNLLTLTNAVNIGVGVQYNIATLWKNHSKVDQAKASRAQVEANEGLLTDAVRYAVQEAYLNLLLSRRKIDMYGSAVAQAEENYKITKNKYDNALATATDLLDADIERLQAKLNATFAESDASLAYSKLLQTTGTLGANSIAK